MSSPVRVLLFASLADLTGIRECAVDLAADLPAGSGRATAGGVLDHLVERHPLLARHRDGIALAVNERYARPDTPVEPGDVVALVPPVSGG